MAKAKKRKTAAKKPAKRRPAEKKIDAKAIAANRKSQWEAYRSLQKKVDLAWDKLKNDIKKKASPKVLIKGKNELLLLLGECNYMANECMRIMGKKGR